MYYIYTLIGGGSIITEKENGIVTEICKRRFTSWREQCERFAWCIAHNTHTDCWITVLLWAYWCHNVNLYTVYHITIAYHFVHCHICSLYIFHFACTVVFLLNNLKYIYLIKSQKILVIMMSFNCMMFVAENQ